ncbi:MAG: hypothetical protein IKL40_03040 [Clostridia bacterium]|nr:hypothetical protein [Clostridia bacterium]
MEIDKKQIMNKLSCLSDEELQNVVRSIAMSAGVSPRRTEQAVSDIDKLRKSFSSMTERDLQRALSVLDDDTVENIKRQMKM